MQPRGPSFTKCAYPPQKIAAVVAELTQQGVAAAAALEGSGLEESQLRDASTRVSYSQMDTVFRNALGLSRDPTIALRAGERMHVLALGVYGYALMSSSSQFDGVAYAQRYLGVTGPLTDTRIEVQGDTVVCSCEPLHWSDPAQDIYRFVVEFSLSTHLTVGRDMVGAMFNFDTVEVAHAAPAHAQACAVRFGCPVQFGRQRNRMTYAASWLERPVVLADPVSNAAACEACEKMLAELDRAGGIAGDVRRALLAQPGKFPSIEAMADRLSIHPRALRRRLEAEGTSYRDLLAEVRARLAIEYLRQTAMTNEEIASRLGYSDAANFRHAFARWTGKSPSEFRAD